MDLLTEPVLKQPRRAADTHTAIEWLDALSTGACDRDAFVRGVNDLLLRAPDAGWEVLALLDQYFRRGRISAETFGYLKAHLQRALMSKGRVADVNLPVPTAEPAPMHVAEPAHVTGSRHVTGPAQVAEPAHITGPTPVTRLAYITGPAPDAGHGAAPTPASGPERTLVPGDVLRDRYRVVGLLGRGGMGAVFEAIDEFRLDRGSEQRVAIKVLHSAVIQRPRLFAELRREFQHLQSLSHPNIVRVHEFDRDGDTAFFTMEYLSGDLLSRVLAAHESTPLYRPYSLAIIRDVGAAVAHAHARGVVHGDLNPGNIFITDGGEVRVLDFGASFQLRRTPWISEFESQEQLAVATPTYASCELIEGETADVRDDIYALACIMYVLLTAKHPFGDQSAIRARTLRLKPRRPSGLTGRQWHALRSALDFKRENRPSDMQTWLNRLDLRAAVPILPPLPTLQAASRGRGHRMQPVVIGGVIALLLGCAVWWATTNGDTLARAQTQAADLFQSTFSRDTAPTNTNPADDAATAQTPAAPNARPPPSPAPVSDSPTATSPNPSDATASHANSPAVTLTATHAATEPATAPPHPPKASSVAHAAARASEDIPASASGASGPSSAPVPYRARVELSSDNVDMTLDDTVARVVVRRSRLMRGDATFSWWTESGTAKPGRDFIPVKAHTETLGSGKSTATLFVPILADATRRDPRSFYVVIDTAGDNAAVGPRTLTQVTIPGLD